MAIGGRLPQPTKTLIGAAPWRAAARWEWLGALALPAFVFGLIQSATGNIIGIDGYYHIKVAWLIREHGPRIDFPWLRFTILNVRGKTVVVFVGRYSWMSADQFAAFLPKADRILASLRFPA